MSDNTVLHVLPVSHVRSKVRRCDARHRRSTTCAQQDARSENCRRAFSTHQARERDQSRNSNLLDLARSSVNSNLRSLCCYWWSWNYLLSSFNSQVQLSEIKRKREMNCVRIHKECLRCMNVNSLRKTLLSHRWFVFWVEFWCFITFTRLWIIARFGIHHLSRFFVKSTAQTEDDNHSDIESIISNISFTQQRASKKRRRMWQDNKVEARYNFSAAAEFGAQKLDSKGFYIEKSR